jgi:hypothetical protein
MPIVEVRVTLTVPEMCRYCDRPTFLKDDQGPLHPCCKVWIGEWGCKACSACSRFNHEQNDKRAVRGKKVGATVTREEHRQRLLGRIKAANGLWVGEASLAQNASPEVAALVHELIGYGQKIECRQNPTDPSERQYRLAAPVDIPMTFDGDTYVPVLDEVRLSGEMQQVFKAIIDGEWRTLDEIQEQIVLDGGKLYPLQSISARLRDLRKDRFGARQVERRRRGAEKVGLFEYRLVPTS